MSNNRFKLEGLDQLYADLRRLPDDLRDEALVVVVETGDEAKDEIQAAYEASQVTGNLAKGVTVETIASGEFGVAVRVKSRAPHAFIFENGTQARHNALGANRGAMPPGNVFIPIMQRRRRVMYHLLTDVVKRAGFEIRGTP